VNPRLLKSDQDGIEKLFLMLSLTITSSLKSDQDGIEKLKLIFLSISI